MMDTDPSVMQERIGQLCGQFKLPTVAAVAVARFTAAVYRRPGNFSGGAGAGG